MPIFNTAASERFINKEKETEKPGFRRMPVIFRARICGSAFTRHGILLSIKLGNSAFYSA